MLEIYLLIYFLYMVPYSYQYCADGAVPLIYIIIMIIELSLLFAIGHCKFKVYVNVVFCFRC